MASRLPKSYLIPSIGLLMLKVQRAEQKTHDKIVKYASSSHTKYKQMLLRHYATLPGTTYLHEWGHILQSVYYPYLYLRNVRELGLIDTLLREFQMDTEPQIKTEWSLSEDFRTSFILDAFLYRVTSKEDGGLTVGPATSSRQVRRDFCEVDLIEEANSIFEFKVTIEDYGDGEQYHDWLKQGAKYTTIFRLLSKIFGRRDARMRFCRLSLLHVTTQHIQERHLCLLLNTSAGIATISRSTHPNYLSRN